VNGTTNGATDGSEKKADAEQLRLMAEECILVDGQDKVTGHGSKKYCHLMENIKKGVLHRAFSVFLFNSKGELLLQQRSAAKITFPLRWTNTCCSHPLYVKDEMEEKDNTGVKRAALRKLEHELGISQGQISMDEVHHLTKIHYLADSDGTEWGEHEVDHILFIQKDVATKVNENEVADIKYVTPKELKQMFDDTKSKNLMITPWCQLICEQFLNGWWDNLAKVIKNKGLGGDESSKVHKLGV